MILNKGYIIYVYPEGVVQLSHPCDVYWRKETLELTYLHGRL